MVNVREVNEVLREKGLAIELPFPSDWLVREMEILEKKDTSDSVGVLLALKMVDGDGREVSELYYGESPVRRERKARDVKIELPSKGELLPLRSGYDFGSDDEAFRYVRGAFIHLLVDKGYGVWGEGFSGEVDSVVVSLLESGEVDIYGEKAGRGFVVRVALRSDDADGYAKVRGLVDLRKEHGSRYDYGLVVPAFQQSLGVRWRDQEMWLTVHGDYLSVHRIGVYGVDNVDPNRIYPFTVYVKERELFKYMVNSSRQWSVVRGRYLQQRSSRGGSG